MELLVRSIAPKVFHMDSVKAGVLCQLFGGCPKAFPGAFSAFAVAPGGRRRSR